MSQFLSLLFHAGVAGLLMFVLLAIVGGATSKVGAASMGPVLLGLAVGDLLIAAATVWLFCRRIAALGGSTLPWGLAAGVLMLILLVVMALMTLVVTNR